MEQITLEEVRKHNKPEDLWVVIDNKVYDLTKYRHEHPGGEDVLDEVAGRDATKDFNDVGHSKEAREIMKKYCIGELAEKDRAKNKAKYVGAFAAMLLGVAFVFLVKKNILTK